MLFAEVRHHVCEIGILLMFNFSASKSLAASLMRDVEMIPYAPVQISEGDQAEQFKQRSLMAFRLLRSIVL